MMGTCGWTKLAAFAAVLAVCAGCAGEEGAETTSHQPDAGVFKRSVQVTAEVEVEGDTWGIAAVPGAVWVQVDPPVDALVRIDTRSKEVTAKIERGRNAAFDGRDLWVAGAKLLRVDPTTGEARGAVHVDSTRVAIGEGAVWIQTADGKAAIVRVDPGTMEVVATIPVRGCSGPRELLVGYGSVWLACMDSDAVARIDPRTNEVSAMIRSGAAPHHVVAGEDAVWVNNIDDANVARIDPKSGKVVAHIPVTGGGIGITVGRGFVWAARDAGIVKIDPNTNTVVGEMLLGPARYYGLAFAEDGLWVTTVAARRVLRLDPTRTSSTE